MPIHRSLLWVAFATSVAATRERTAAVKNVAGASNVPSAQQAAASGFIAVKSTASSEDQDARSHDKAALQQLTAVAQDLESAKAHDHKEETRIEQQIVSLVHQRDAEKRDEKRKAGEIAFLEDEIGRVRRRLSKTGAAAATAVTASVATEDSAEAAVATEATSATAADSSTEVATATAADSSELSEAEAAATEADKVIEQVDSGAAASASLRGGAAAQASTAADSAAAEENRRLRAELEAEKAKAAAAQRAKEEEERAKEAAARAKQEAAEKAKAEAEAKEKAERDAAEAAEKEKKDKANALADSADDSFKNFMKEEDGEDDQGDPEYEDSANALAGAIGWNRKEVEANADKGIKQLTEAIGGKKVVQSLQGMMAGIGR